MADKIRRTRRNTISKIKTNSGKKNKPKLKNTKKGSTLISESGKRKSFKKIPIGKKPVLGDVTQGFDINEIAGVIDEGGSPKLTTTKAIVDRSADKLGVPKLALRGGGRAYGKNS